MGERRRSRRLGRQGEVVSVSFPMSYCACSVAQPCPTLCDPMDCSPPGSSVPGIAQARILEWVAISYYRGSSPPRVGIHLSCVSCIGRFFTTEPLGKPMTSNFL